MFFENCCHKSEEYTLSVKFLTEMDMMYRAWHGMQFGGSLKRSELMMLAVLQGLLKTNDNKVTVSMLAKHLNQSLPGVSQKISVLEEQACIKRLGKSKDRRVIYIKMTEKGRKMMEEAMNGLFSHFEEILSKVGEEQILQMLSVMNKITAEIEKK